MQTFMPYNCFKLTALSLDNKRLGKQRVEAWQVLRALRGETKGWVNHPATVMWRGYEQALIHYGMTICAEWQERGFKDSLYDKFRTQHLSLSYAEPWWMGYEPLHTSHQSNLYRKDANYYSEFAVAPRDLPYVWCHPDGTYHLGTDKTLYTTWFTYHAINI
jgi:hypothetical protein